MNADTRPKSLTAVFLFLYPFDEIQELTFKDVGTIVFLELNSFQGLQASSYKIHIGSPFSLLFELSFTGVSSAPYSNFTEATATVVALMGPAVTLPRVDYSFLPTASFNLTEGMQTLLYFYMNTILFNFYVFKRVDPGGPTSNSNIPVSPSMLVNGLTIFHAPNFY